MIYSDKYKYIFLHVPKNAGTSIKKILEKKYDGNKIMVHVSASDGQLKLKEWNKYFKFAIVRNPYSRVVSWYNHLIRESEEGVKKDFIIRPSSFMEFFDQEEIYTHKKTNMFRLWQTQFEFLSIKDKLAVDKIIKFENLKSDWKDICNELFGDYTELGHEKNWGVGNNWIDYYDKETIKLVNERFQKDFEVFNYDILR